MAEADTKGIRERFSALKSERSGWDSLWRDIRDYELPDLGCFEGEEEKANTGGKRYQKMYDAEVPNCADMLAAGLLGGVSSPSRPWLRLTTMDPDLDKQPDVKQWLAEVKDRMLVVLAKSEAYNALHRSYLELPVFGTACTLVQPHPANVIDLQNLTIGEYYLADDQYGRVDTVYRRLQMSAKQMAQAFGIDQLSQAAQSALKTNPFQRFSVIHAIEPRLERDIMKHDAVNMPWASVYMEEGAEEGRCLSVSGFKQFPALCPRWLTTAGSVYGRGPGAKALSAAKSLQRLQLRLSTLADYLTDPPIQFPAKHVRMLNLYRPGGRIPVDPSDNEAVRTAWEVKTDPSVIQALIQARKEEVRSYFYVNVFQMIAMAQQEGDRTATEVAALEQEKALMLGPVLERLHTEMLDPLVDMAFQRMLEMDMLPEVPDILLGRELSVEYISVLAEAQKNSSVDGITKTVQQLGLLAQLKPETVDKIDMDTVIEQLADMNGVPPECIVSGRKVAMVRQQRAQEMAAQQDAQNQAVTAQAMKDMGQAADSEGLQQMAQQIRDDQQQDEELMP